jgi:hypothetical protein
VEVLAAGGSHLDAACAAGVARETVSRWVSHSPAVRSALGRIRYASAEAVTDRVLRVQTLALEVLEAHLETVDRSSPEALSAAVAVLRAVPSVTVNAPEPPEVVAGRMLAAIRPVVASESPARMLAEMDDPGRNAERVAVNAAGIV